MPTSKADGETLITVAIDEQLKNQVRSEAALQGKTFKDVLDEALRGWLRAASPRMSPVRGRNPRKRKLPRDRSS